MSDCLHPFLELADCKHCRGSGHKETASHGESSNPEPCPRCGGTGRRDGYEQCDTCMREFKILERT